MRPDHREIELKLRIDRAGRLALARLGALEGWTLGPPKRSRLVSVYYDTGDFRLHAAGIALRVRRKGRLFLMGVKADRRSAAGVSMPHEHEAAVDGPEPRLGAIADPGLRLAVEKALAGGTLAARFETDVMRTTRTIENAAARLELALDEGAIRAGDRSLPLLEAELELQEGASDALAMAARGLFMPLRCAPSPLSKAAAGVALVGGESGSDRAGPAPAATGKAAGLAVLDQRLSMCAEDLAAARAVILETDEPEGPHRLRVALRRLRTILRAFRPQLEGAGIELDEAARTLGSMAGALRDVDVLAGDLCAPLARDAQETAGFEALQRLLAEEAQESRTALRRALEGEAWRRILLEQALLRLRLVDRPALAEPVGGLAAAALDKAWKRTARRAANIETLDSEARHDLRKALKGLRYTAEAFAGLYAPEATGAFINRLKKMQDVFGYLNDAANAGGGIEIVRARAPDDGAAREAAGYLLGWHSAGAEACWPQARRHWRKLKRQARFWR